MIIMKLNAEISQEVINERSLFVGTREHACSLYLFAYKRLQYISFHTSQFIYFVAASFFFNANALQLHTKFDIFLFWYKMKTISPSN